MPSLKGKIVGLILAGGQARRFGRPKCLEHLEGKPLIHWVYTSLKEVCQEIWLSLRDEEQTKIYQHLLIWKKIVLDPLPGQGPLPAVAAAATTLRPEDLLLVVPCDQPLLRPTLLKTLLNQSLNTDFWGIFCQDQGGRLLPFPAVFRKRLFAGCALETLAEKSFRKFLAPKEILCLPPSVWQKVDPQGLSFFNINYQKDLERAKGLFPLLKE